MSEGPPVTQLFTLTDSAGNTSNVSVTLKAVTDTAPAPPSGHTVTQSLADGQTLSGKLAWTATATGTPKPVVFTVDGGARFQENTAPFQYAGDPDGRLDTTTLTNGPHTFLVEATYPDGTARSTVTATVANGAGPTPPPTATGFLFPAFWHKWGGNEKAALAQGVDALVANNPTSNGPAFKTAKAANPNLVGVVMSTFATNTSFSFTYGGGLRGFTGANDNLQPSPQGPIRGFQSADSGCKFTFDNNVGFNLSNPGSADFIRKAAFYAWKLQAQAYGWSGVWSDNLYASNLLGIFGSCPVLNVPGWKTGYLNICNGLRELAGGALVGGNVAYRATDPAERAATDIAEREYLDDDIRPGANHFEATLREIVAWQNTGRGGRPSYLLCGQRVAGTDAAGMRLGLAMACVAGGAWRGAATSGDPQKPLYFPPEMERNGKRGWLGKPTGAYTRSGDLFTRPFEHGKAYANLGSGAVTADGHTVAAHDGLLV